MSGAIEGFYSTWEAARRTFGEGMPRSGEHFDDSSTALRGLDSHLASAAPGDRWRGTAATAYDAANAEHRAVIATIADLDKQLAAEITNSAELVSRGRQSLESVRQWVAAAAASVPPGRAGERMKLVIAKRGLARLQDVIQTTNAESNAIGGRVQALNGEYRKLGLQGFARKH